MGKQILIERNICTKFITPPRYTGRVVTDETATASRLMGTRRREQVLPTAGSSIV